MGLETLIGNALALGLKHRTPFATKAIPIALFVFNTFYVMLRTYDPAALANFQSASVSPAGYLFGYDSLYVNTSWLGGLGGLAATALQETMKQTFGHTIAKNTVGQYLVPLLYKMFKKRSA